MSLYLFCIPIYLDLFLPYYYVLYFVYLSAFFHFFSFCAYHWFTLDLLNIFSPFSSSAKSESSLVVSDSIRLHGLYCSLPGSSVHGILQGRVLAWVAIPFSRGSSWPRDQIQVSHITGIFFTIWATREAPFWKFYIFTPFFFRMINLIFLTCVLVLKLTSFFLCLLNKMNVIIPLMIQSFLKFEILLDSQKLKKRVLRSPLYHPLDFCQW